ncbi:armadillo-type protein [Colletotrichum godetiae]|uniref:Armadillo-type protein n=1 Tax=Colletotrichum godetiae TaxID=1209918 RepID=A0AAJ0ESB2_9PEZI|nr:armadillo-type protein [Colletotrichum godetiae]KAK1673687.1 armadillo-type protein [Colletotrichum godetiae]
MTTLYEAMQTSLWKKDIWRLEKKHEGERIETDDLKNAGQLSVERHVKAEASFLEHLAFAGLVADKLEFESEYRDMINEYATSSSSDLMLDKTLPCLSFLRSSDPSVEPIHQSYHFIHLTFQEYFAARHFVQHWNHHQPFKQHLPGQRSGGDITPVEFFKRHKYDTQYDVMWRFVAGLLDKEKNASNFFEEIEKEPIDLLGPTHQRLVMHCLNEAFELPTGLRDQREGRLLQWVLFERDFAGSSTFIREPEIPEPVLNSALNASGGKTSFLDALNYSQRHLSDTSMAALVRLLKDEDGDVRKSAAKALGNQWTSSDTITAALVGLLKDEDKYVRSSAAEALGNQSTLSDTTTAALIELLKDEDWRVQSSTADALVNQSTLSDNTIVAIVGLLEDEDKYVRYFAAKALGNQSTLSETTMAALVRLLKEEDSNVRYYAAKVLGNQSTLSDTTMVAFIGLLEDEDKYVRSSAARALGNQSTLSDTTTAALVELLKDEDSNVRYYAAITLGNQSTLSDTTMVAFIGLLKDEDGDIRSSAAYVLGIQSTLSDTTMVALVGLLKDEGSNVRESAAKTLGNQSTLSYTTMAALVGLLKDEDSNVRSSAAYVLGIQSTLSDTTMVALVGLLKDEGSNVRESAAKTLGNQSTLSDKILDTLGMYVQPEEQTLDYSHDLESFYESFLQRSFQEHFCLSVDRDVYVINQASGLRKAKLKDESRFQVEIRTAQCQLEKTYSLGLWSALGRQNEDTIHHG